MRNAMTHGPDAPEAGSDVPAGRRGGAFWRRPATWRRGAVAALVLLLPAAAPAAMPTAGAATPRAPQAAAPDCSEEYRITHKLPNGTEWQMCYRNNDYAGLVLEDISYRPKGANSAVPVLNSARLGQIHVPYDDGGIEYYDVTDISLGTSPVSLKEKDCPGGTRRPVKVGGEAYDAVCVTQQPRGFAHFGNSWDVGEENGRNDSAQGDDLVVYTIHSAGYYYYITQWNFSDDGTITAKEGATGNLSPGDFDASDKQGWPIGKGSRDRATSHQHNIFWRLDFQTDASRPAKIQQYDTNRSGTGEGGYPAQETTRKNVTKETSGNSGQHRWWRVSGTAGKNGDGHTRSWELVHSNSARYTGRKFTSKDVYFTQYKKCEKFPNHNRRWDADCSKDIVAATDGEQLKHPIVWVNVGFHHIARDEDQTPMPVHWQGFQLSPRDVTDMSPLTPERLRKPQYNGDPFD